MSFEKEFINNEDSILNDILLNLLNFSDIFLSSMGPWAAQGIETNILNILFIIFDNKYN